jgi:hypothetical protein
MFEFIKKWFSKEDTIQINTDIVSKTINNRKKHMASIDFQINHDGTMNILCDWPEFKDIEPSEIDKVADKYAMLMYMINNNLLVKDIIEILSEAMASTNPFDAYFVHQVLAKWLEINKKAEKENTVENKQIFIKPSSVFKNYNQ